MPFSYIILLLTIVKKCFKENNVECDFTIGHVLVFSRFCEYKTKNERKTLPPLPLIPQIYICIRICMSLNTLFSPNQLIIFTRTSRITLISRKTIWNYPIYHRWISESKINLHGVPQGSILGPVIFYHFYQWHSINKFITVNYHKYNHLCRRCLTFVK